MYIDWIIGYTTMMMMMIYIIIRNVVLSTTPSIASSKETTQHNIRLSISINHMNTYILWPRWFWSPNVIYCKYCTHLFHSFAWYVCTTATCFIIQFCSPSLTFCCLTYSLNSKLLPELYSSISSKFMFTMLTTIPLATYEYLSQSEYWDLEPNNFFGATGKQILENFGGVGECLFWWCRGSSLLLQVEECILQAD